MGEKPQVPSGAAAVGGGEAGQRTGKGTGGFLWLFEVPEELPLKRVKGR